MSEFRLPGTLCAGLPDLTVISAVTSEQSVAAHEYGTVRHAAGRKRSPAVLRPEQSPGRARQCSEKRELSFCY